jgi:hypothetical protein
MAAIRVRVQCHKVDDDSYYVRAGVEILHVIGGSSSFLLFPCNSTTAGMGWQQQRCVSVSIAHGI